MVECLLPKQNVAGSIPVSRSKGRVAKLADAYASGAYGAIHVGSSPTAPTFDFKLRFLLTSQNLCSSLTKE